MKRALIIGINGQDGSYLAKFLLNKGYEVVGTSRDAMASSFSNLKKLGIELRVQNISMALNDFRSVLAILKKFAPDEIYNLAGQTSVGLSFEQPVETMESITFGALNILEAIRFIDSPIHFYNAGSSECFGDTKNLPASESTPFSPRSPYAVAKTAAYGLVNNYRESYGLYACTGILFNHESQLRPERFVTQKIIKAASFISKNLDTKLSLGNISIYRDWGWAPEYIEAMWLMLQRERPEDFVIATGKSVSLEYFIEKAFSYHGLSWKNHVLIDSSFLRPSDIEYGAADPRKAESILGWKAKYDVDDVIRMMSATTQDVE
jgi:GDPmannose 4,6-dehydratase